MLVGAFAVAAALGLGQQPHGIMDVLTALMDTRLQTVLAASIGLGLACLAGYFAIRGLSHCCRGSGARCWLFGAGMIADALIYGAVMISLLGIALGWHPDGERETQLWTAWALSQPFGRGVVGFVGLVILGCGIGVIAWVMTTDVDDDVDLPESEKRVIEPIARYGLAGRGVGAALVGIYWMSAGIHGEASRAHELGGALQTVQQNSRGWPATAAARGCVRGVGRVRFHRGALPSTSRESDEALMATTHREPHNGIETAILHELRLLPRWAQEAYLDALTRLAEGQPIEECLVEVLTELGYRPAEVRQQVRAAVERKGFNWREALN